MNLKKHILPKGWTETKISEETYLINIDEQKIEAWKVKRWKEDNVEKLIEIDGFHMKTYGRNGTIYYVEENKLCEIYFESSAVKEFDILIFFEQVSEWQLPKQKEILEKENIREKLILWLKAKKIKSDL